MQIQRYKSYQIHQELSFIEFSEMLAELSRKYSKDFQRWGCLNGSGG